MTFGAVLVMIIAVCGDGVGTGCGVTVQTIRFASMEACETAKAQFFPDMPGEPGYNDGEWQPRREMRCVDNALQ